MWIRVYIRFLLRRASSRTAIRHDHKQTKQNWQCRSRRKFNQCFAVGWIQYNPHSNDGPDANSINASRLDEFSTIRTLTMVQTPAIGSQAQSGTAALWWRSVPQACTTVLLFRLIKILRSFGLVNIVIVCWGLLLYGCWYILVLLLVGVLLMVVSVSLVVCWYVCDGNFV